MVESSDVVQAEKQYRSALEQLAELDDGKGGVPSGARRHNRLVDEMRSSRGVLRSSTTGQEALASLLSDPRPVVRLWAAGDLLGWRQELARPVLEALRDSAEVGLHAVSAKYTLGEFDAGRLD